VDDKQLMMASPTLGVPSGSYHDSNMNGLNRELVEDFCCPAAESSTQTVVIITWWVNLWKSHN